VLNVCRVFELQSVAVGSFRVVVIVVLSVVGSDDANTSNVAKIAHPRICRVEKLSYIYEARAGPITGKQEMSTQHDVCSPAIETRHDFAEH
jgi:hypothetical protein